jgi:hypothetical protein
MTAIVSSIVHAPGLLLSNGCAILAFTAVLVTAGLAAGQEVTQPSAASATSENRVTSTVSFLGGAAVGLAAHEAGHLLFDGIFDANPGIKRVSFGGIPFFAITHDTMSRRKEFIIDSAGFWVQEATNEILLTGRPNLRKEHAPFTKGVFAFNVLVSVGYAGAAFGRVGPAERDTRGMAESLGWKEPYVGLLILVPAVLDIVRYYNPDARWATWGSRAAKIGGVALIAR